MSMRYETDEEIHGLVAHLFRHQAGRMVSTLTRIFGSQNLDLAEEVVLEALIKALQIWPYHGTPRNPATWLIEVAKNRAFDLLRRESVFREKSEALLKTFTVQQAQIALRSQTAMTGEVLDDELKMMFMCCHPDLPKESRVALTLKTVGGLSVSEIARAFLAREETIAQRMVRAKHWIRKANILFEMPPAIELSKRLDSVLEVLYLLFNEGYTTHQGEDLVRAELCDEAIYLCSLLVKHPATNLPKTQALLTLMLFQAARFPARVNLEGDIQLLNEQDRSLWDRRLIQQGLVHLEHCAEGEEVTEYHLQAGIAACHAVAESDQATDWGYILELYNQLLVLNPSPVVELNRAVALSQLQGPEAGILALTELENQPALSRYYLLPATLAELWRKLGDQQKAAAYYQQALSYPCSEPERRFLLRKLSATI